MLKTLTLLPLLLLLAACGSTQEAGDSCTTEDSGVCSSSTEALICNNKTLRAVPCTGPAGCIDDDSRFACDFSRAKSGDACPTGAANTAQCDVSNANQALKCTSNVWQAQACKACSVQSGSVFCQP